MSDLAEIGDSYPAFSKVPDTLTMLRCSEAAVQLILFQNTLELIVKALAFKWGLKSGQRRRQVRGCSPFQ